MAVSRGEEDSRVEPFRPRKVLVTGGAGFIGSNFVHHLLAADPEVEVVDLDLLTYAGRRENLEGLPDGGARHTLVEGDICDRDLVERLLREHDVDAIVHFAAESHVDRSIDGPGAFVRTNVHGTFTLLEAARACWLHGSGAGRRSRFHHISTDEVYGTLTAEDPPFCETTPYTPNSPYSAAKAASDHLVRAYHHTYGLDAVTTNCSNNYGPRQHDEKLLPTVIRCCHLEEPIPVYGDGSNVRDWLYVEDHCRAIELVLRRGRAGETYNVGGDSERSNIDLVRTLCVLADEIDPRDEPRERLITFVTDRPGHDWRYAIDCRKLCGELGWRQRETLESGLRKTIAWYLENERWRQLVEAGAAGGRLGLGGGSTP